MFKKHSKSYSSLAGINDASRRTKRQTRTAALTFNLNGIKEHAASAITPMIFTNRTEEEVKRIRMNSSPCKRGIFWFLCIPYHNVSVIKIK